MRKVELLAPAGSMEALYAAVQNGCDAVYLGGPGFGARAFAHNFTREELLEAVRYAHVYDVRVFVTVNTLIEEADLDAICEYIRFLQEGDVDALIIQDLGLLQLVLRQFPDMEVHASTQMHVHNAEGIHFLKKQGVARVVVPRETSLEEIRELAKQGVDLEVFVQGALCVSYSGQCLMSSVLFDRSGNKGACAQPCRMQYDLIKEVQGKKTVMNHAGDYLLSPKDLNTLSVIGELIDAGVASFKIEGRMKRPEYVAYMVAMYRKAIDAHMHHQHFQVSKEIQENMEKLFHRGFTKGHIYHQMGGALMNPYRPNHMGVEIGKVVRIEKDQMIISLHGILEQGDGIRIISGAQDEGFRVNRIYQRGLLVNRGEREEIALDRIHGIKPGAILLKTSAVTQLKQLQESYAGYHRRVEIDASFVMIKQAYAQLTLWDATHSVSVESAQVVELARKTALTEERIRTQLAKTKDSPFQLREITISADADATMPIAELNRMRREAVAQLITQRETRHEARRELAYQASKLISPSTRGVHVTIHTKEQYEAICHLPVTLYCATSTVYKTLKEAGANIAYRNPRVRKEKLLDGMSNDIGALDEDRAMVCDTGYNVTNHLAAELLFAHGASCVLLSTEVNLKQALSIAKQSSGLYGYVVYAKRELMLSEYCVINAVEQDSDKKQCGLCKQANYYLQDQKQRVFPVLCDEACRMHILEEHAMNRIHEIPAIKPYIHHIACIFTNEDGMQCERILKEILHEW